MQTVKSHKNKFYADHLNEILRVSFYLLDLLNPPKKEEYKEVLYYITFYHDIFKLTKEFQNYLNERAKEKPKIKHAELSGLLLYLNKDLLPSKYQDIITAVCLSHHTFPKIINPLNKEEYKESLGQLPKLLEEVKSYLSTLDFRNDKLNKIKENFLNKNLSTEFDILNTLISETNKKYSIEDYLDFLYVYSLFVIADRVSASFERGNFEEYYKEILYNLIDLRWINEEKLTKYLESLLKEGLIDHLRESARKEAINNLDTRKNIFILELPTGLGKTLTSLQIALRIKENRPIIYSLPFLSIIEQTQSLFEKIFKDRISTIHHISPLEIDENNFEENFVEKYLLPYKIKDITITTHERLRRTLFPSSRSDILLFPFLVNAVWIIDEIQLYPLDELYPLSKLVEQISKQFNTKFIIMSATIPTLRFENTKVVELIRDKKKYQLNRYKIKKFGRKDHEKIYLETIKLLQEGKSVGIIVNTVRESLNLYQFFLDQLEKMFLVENPKFDEKDPLILRILHNPLIYKEIKEVLMENSILDPKLLVREIKFNDSIVYLIFLNGKIPSLYKRRVLEILKRIKNENQVLIISTQSLEAGVDIDLDVIFREVDTFDSIVQTAGRVNRNNKKSKGAIYLVHPDKNILYFRIVRGIGYNWIKNFIEKYRIEEKEEKDIHYIIKDWYNFLMNHVIPLDGKGILDAISKFDFSKIRGIHEKATKEYVICEGRKIKEVLDNKLFSKPYKYEEKLKFLKQFSLNSRLLFLYKIDIFEDEDDILEKIEHLLTSEIFY